MRQRTTYLVFMLVAVFVVGILVAVSIDRARPPAAADTTPTTPGKPAPTPEPTPDANLPPLI